MKELADEASCVAVSKCVSFMTLGTSPLIAVATWSEMNPCLSIHDGQLGELMNFDLPGRSYVAQELTLTALQDRPYVFCATSNGFVFLFGLARSEDSLVVITESRAVSLGVQPAQLHVRPLSPPHLTSRNQ